MFLTGLSKFIKFLLNYSRFLKKPKYKDVMIRKGICMLFKTTGSIPGEQNICGVQLKRPTLLAILIQIRAGGRNPRDILGYLCVRFFPYLSPSRPGPVHFSLSRLSGDLTADWRFLAVSARLVRSTKSTCLVNVIYVC